LALKVVNHRLQSWAPKTVSKVGGLAANGKRKNISVQHVPVPKPEPAVQAGW